MVRQAGATPAMTVVTWVGASTAVFAALVAVAQNDIKRILAYSTVSQLGYMMVGLGVGGVAVGMFHLITHAFFKALLFMGAGSVIHGAHEEQDIRKMGGLEVHAADVWTYADRHAGVVRISAVLLRVLEQGRNSGGGSTWSVSSVPFYMLVFGALLTAFYMTRQVSYVFFGTWRGHGHAHESPRVMTMPLAILAFFAIALGRLERRHGLGSGRFSMGTRPRLVGQDLMTRAGDVDVDVIGGGAGWARARPVDLRREVTCC